MKSVHFRSFHQSRLFNTSFIVPADERSP